MRRQSKLPQNHNVTSSSSDDDGSNSDSDNSLEHQTASDIINSFLNPNQSSTHRVNNSKSRKASDVINTFLQKNKIVDQANHSQFNSALDVINSYLRKDKFPGARISVSQQRSRKDSTDDSTSESDSKSVSRKRGREIIDSSSTSDSDSTTNRTAVAKKRRIENGHASTTGANEAIKNETVATIEGNVDDDNVIPSNGHSHSQTEESRQSATHRTLRKRPTINNGSTINENQTNPRQKASEMLKVSFTREVFSRKLRTRRIVEQHITIKDTEIPKDKYDRALNILNATECHYDETPVKYGAPKTSFDVRRSCNSRRHAEATHDSFKLGSSGPISLTRIVTELDNCLKRENWQQMAELIYFGCGLMKTEQSRRAIGTAFFTYALLLLILDSTPDSISTLDGKRQEIFKFFIALGSEPEECEEFLKELNFVMDDGDTSND